MSHVADIILVTALSDGCFEQFDRLPENPEERNVNADKVGKWLFDTYRCRFVQVDGASGGNKCMQANVFLCAVNYLDILELVRVFRSVQWESPESAQLFIKDEHDDAFTVYSAIA